MRKPSEYLPAAYAKLRNSLMSDCSVVLRHGDSVATVTRVGGTSRGADELSEGDVNVNAHVLAASSDFPDLKIGSAVEVDESLRVVVSLDTDPARALLSVGLSSAFEKCAAALSGTRRADNATQTINFKLDVLLLESGTADTYSNALAPSYAHVYLVGIRRADWGETSDPEPGDNISVAPEGYEIALKVSTVTRHDGWYILRCRTKG